MQVKQGSLSVTMIIHKIVWILLQNCDIQITVFKILLTAFSPSFMLKVRENLSL